MCALKIAVLSDGRPGHYNQSSGLVRLLSADKDVDVMWCDVRIHQKWLRSLLQWLLNAGFWFCASTVLYCLHGKSPRKIIPHDIDLVIAAGGNTRFLLAWLTATQGLKSLYMGSLRGLKPSLLGKVMTLEDLGVANNIVMPMAPVNIDPEALSLAGESFKESLADNSKKCYLLIVGGSRPDCCFDYCDWQGLAQAMIHIAERDNIQWLLTTSPRTGVVSEKQLCEMIPASILAHSTWFGSHPAKVMSQYLGAADAVFVTEDSTTMITEAVASGRSVTTLSPVQCEFVDRHEAMLERMAQRGLICRKAIATLSNADIKTGVLNTNRLYRDMMAPVLDYINV